MRFVLSILIVLNITAQAQENLSDGLTIDEPHVFLAWGTPMRDLFGYPRLRFRTNLKTKIQDFEWDSITVFHTPVDSAFFMSHYADGASRLGYMLLFFNGRYLDTIENAVIHSLGPPKRAERKGGQFLDVWKTDRFYAFINNRYRVGRQRLSCVGILWRRRHF